jgi:hypothetical protein
MLGGLDINFWKNTIEVWAGIHLIYTAIICSNQGAGACSAAEAVSPYPFSRFIRKSCSTAPFNFRFNAAGLHPPFRLANSAVHSGVIPADSKSRPRGAFS